MISFDLQEIWFSAPSTGPSITWVSSTSHIWILHLMCYKRIHQNCWLLFGGKLLDELAFIVITEGSAKMVAWSEEMSNQWLAESFTTWGECICQKILCWIHIYSPQSSKKVLQEFCCNSTKLRDSHETHKLQHVQNPSCKEQSTQVSSVYVSIQRNGSRPSWIINIAEILPDPNLQWPWGTKHNN